MTTHVLAPLALLRRLEWSGLVGGFAACPYCDGFAPEPLGSAHHSGCDTGHSERCELTTLLNSEPADVRVVPLAALEWIVGRDTGLSSEHIWAHMLGVHPRYAVPCDGGDRGRCLRLLSLIPEWWSRLAEMKRYAGWADAVRLLERERT